MFETTESNFDVFQLLSHFRLDSFHVVLDLIYTEGNSTFSENSTWNYWGAEVQTDWFINAKRLTKQTEVSQYKRFKKEPGCPSSSLKFDFVILLHGFSKFSWEWNSKTYLEYLRQIPFSWYFMYFGYPNHWVHWRDWSIEVAAWTCRYGALTLRAPQSPDCEWLIQSRRRVLSSTPCTLTISSCSHTFIPVRKQWRNPEPNNRKGPNSGYNQAINYTGLNIKGCKSLAAPVQVDFPSLPAGATNGTCIPRKSAKKHLLAPVTQRTITLEPSSAQDWNDGFLWDISVMQHLFFFSKIATDCVSAGL